MKRSVRSLGGLSIALLACLLTPAGSFAIDEFPVPTPASNPAGIAAGPGGTLWFTEEATSANKIARLTLGVGFSEFAVPTAAPPPAAGQPPETGPAEIVLGPDGALWFTEIGANKVGRFDPATNTFREITVPTSGSKPDAIAAGPDNALWFTESGANKIGRVPVNATSSSDIKEFTIPTGSSDPGDITLGPDDRLWFTEGAGNKIGRIAPTASSGSEIVEFTIPTGASDPSEITASGAALWFTEFGANQIGRIAATAASGSDIAEFSVPTPGSGPSGIATGSDGALWFTETLANKIGRITTSGTVTNEFFVPTGSSQPGGITAGPDGALWFTEFVGNKVGRIETAKPFVAPPPPPAGPAPPGTGSSSKKKCKVPKLKGLTVKKAKKKLKKAGCKARFRGKGKVRSTSPKAGRTTTKRVTVKCKRGGAKRGAHRSAGQATTAGVTAHDLGVNHLSRQPRRNNRRLRVRSGDRSGGALARHGPRAGNDAEVTFEQKRRRAKRALMRRLMAVRGGLQA